MCKTLQFSPKWAFKNYADKKGGGRGRGSPECQRFYKNLLSKLANEGGLVKNHQNSANVI